MYICLIKWPKRGQPQSWLEFSFELTGAWQSSQKVCFGHSGLFIVLPPWYTVYRTLCLQCAVFLFMRLHILEIK